MSSNQDQPPPTALKDAAGQAEQQPPVCVCNVSTYWLTRFFILRLLGFIYAVAFLAAANQIVPLVGDHGLLPAGHFMQRVENRFGSAFHAFVQLPSIFWIHQSDSLMVIIAWVGVGLSTIVLLGYANAVLMAILWMLYMSFVHIGQDWYGYGWEIQLLETGFLAIFLCPLFDPRPFGKYAPAKVVIWLFRWLIFRIMLGAGLIKMRGDPCWRDLTCLYYHYETQPIPNPLSWWLHFQPHWFHKLGVLWNHFVELIVPWFAFWPRIGRHIAGALLVTFQITLILSGNLSFLNWLTIVPALACFDDSLLVRFVPKYLLKRLPLGSPVETVRHELSRRQFLPWALAALIALLSIAPVANMLSSGQIMNTSFNRLHLVNTYGAFGSVGRTRYEIVFEGTDDTTLSAGTGWREYDFKAKPGNPRRRPVFIAPYQHRIDWQIWFAAMSTPDQYPWTLHFIWKLLHNDKGTLSLLSTNPFPERPPHFVRAQYYKYQFALPTDPSGDWWQRTLLGSWLPALSADDPRLIEVMKAYGWTD